MAKTLSKNEEKIVRILDNPTYTVDVLNDWLSKREPLNRQDVEKRAEAVGFYTAVLHMAKHQVKKKVYEEIDRGFMAEDAKELVEEMGDLGAEDLIENPSLLNILLDEWYSLLENDDSYHDLYRDAGRQAIKKALQIKALEKIPCPRCGSTKEGRGLDQSMHEGVMVCNACLLDEADRVARGDERLAVDQWVMAKSMAEPFDLLFLCCMYEEPRTLDWCEENCGRYYGCDTVALINDIFKAMEGVE